MFGRLSQEQRLRRAVEDVMVGCGYSEAYTWSLVSRDADPDAIRLPEPLSAEHAILRTSLLDGLVEAAGLNRDGGNEDIALFEIARVYLPSGDRLPEERWRLGAIVEGGYFPAKGAVEAVHAALGVEPVFSRAREPFLHPGKAARVDAGWVGELHPTLLEGAWGAFELDLASLFAEVPARILYEDVVTYPALRQDLAFVVDEESRRASSSSCSGTAPARSSARPGCSTSTAAARFPRAGSPSRSGLRSSRRSERSPTRTPRRSAAASWRRSPTPSAPSCGPSAARWLIGKCGGVGDIRDRA